jgi:Gram-negative bacterial TonB protein C-terminal
MNSRRRVNSNVGLLICNQVMRRNRSSLFITAIASLALLLPAASRNKAASDIAWQEIAPEGEEFFVTMPAPPQLSRGTLYFDLNRDVLVKFAVYALVHDDTLFVIQSYELPKPKELLNDLLWNRKKFIKIGTDLESNGYKGKSFIQKGDSLFHSGRYFIAQRHVYIVDCARRDSPDPNVERFLNSFAIRSAGQRALPLRLSQISPDQLYSGKEVTRKVVVLSKLEPNFTPEARAAHITGNVTLRANFSSSGLITDVVVLAGLPGGITEQAIEAAKNIVFLPAEKDGKPVSQNLEIRYSFMMY